ncbi:zinc-binding dehydrogenase [Aeromicrobium sp. 636]|uniref:NADP-dependent oxidoreductase n=1 Tax=Aeromicrobium senzhongii TaxID=2663859 RepID=A0A8I0K2E9_9ACTN|nr:MULTISPECIES: NADP-dependent oxidoreductase [Aeromicrobium]MBC9225730.1 NADP-dependent oxidoreductase [Aeromicrobium senzhongii]MCQ3997840.1 zinc-binding dehydrogenase [Aeromicrobium sp. 636]
MARYVTYSRTGGPEVLELHEGPDPTPGDGKVVVEIRAAGVNPIDLKLRAGIRPSPPFTEPRRVGFDGGGVIVAVGAGVDGVGVGDEVVIQNTQGTYATHVVADPGHLTAKPEGVDFETAAALGVPVSTAYQALRSLEVENGDRLLLHGGSGSVGQAVVQLAVARGAHVVATAGERNHDRLRELGATPVTYGEGLLERLREASPEGYTVSLDCAGTQEALETSLELVDRARIGTIVQGAQYHELGLQAWSGGSPEPLTPQQQAWREEAVPAVLPLIASGAFQVEIGRVLPLDQAVEAHRLSEAGDVRGKIVLVP